MACDGRAFRTELHQVARIASMEDSNQLAIVLAAVLEDEAFESLVAFLPIRWASSEQRLEVIEIGRLCGIADLVGSLEMARQPEEDSKLMLRVGIRSVEMS